MNDFSYHFLMIHEARHGAHYHVRPLLVSQGNYSIRSLGEFPRGHTGISWIYLHCNAHWNLDYPFIYFMNLPSIWNFYYQMFAFPID